GAHRGGDRAPSERIRRQPARAVTTTLRAGTAVPALSRLLVRLPGITHRRSSLLGRGTRLRGYCRIAAPPSTPLAPWTWKGASDSAPSSSTTSPRPQATGLALIA